MPTYESRLSELNNAQRQAVETLDGPLLVLAGPGTGKTTLLTVRVAHILKQTDTLPESILCLTFTESAQKTMQSRLVDLLGQDAYKVQIHTFHSFGSWVRHVYPQYFEEYISTAQADDVTSYQLLVSIFERLDHHDPLTSFNDGDYLYLGDVRSRISQLKQAAVTPDELDAVCKADSQWVKQADAAAITDFQDVKTINAGAVSAFESHLENLERLREVSPMGHSAYLELRDALEEAHAGEKVSTKPVTAWKNSWLVKDAQGIYSYKYGSTLKRIISLSRIYRTYLAEMKQRGLTDYDDQLMVLLEALRDQPDLLAELQERFIYLMADEFQDTNGVQQRILETIADNPIHDGRPNIMVVGDDDQAIYGFQGAYSSNVLDFLQRWREVETIILTENYRSSPEIVSFSRSLIVQGENRLEDTYEHIDKNLTTPNASGPAITLKEGNSAIQTYEFLAKDIQKKLDSGVPPEQIAVLAPQHKYLERLVPYLTHYDIGVSYERRQNVLEEQHIHELALLAEVVVALSDQQLDLANTLMSELLSYPWWGIPSETVWTISLTAYKAKTPWLDIMQQYDDPLVKQIADWLIKQGQTSKDTPMENALDTLIGYGQRAGSANGSFVSPYFAYYFLEPATTQTMQYLLTSLISIRRHIRDYTGNEQVTLSHFVNYVSLRRQSGLPVVNDHPLSSKAAAVQLMTAHKSKGLEFDVVYILDAQQSVWGNPRGRSPLIAMPPHILAIQNGESSDENLRKFYVAVTRAAQQLTLLRAQFDSSNNPILPLGWLQDQSTIEKLTNDEISEDSLQEADIVRGVSFEWQRAVTAHTDANWKDRLADRISNYRLSPTHLGTFLDVTSGGPRMFMANHLLRFPQGSNPNIAFGNSMHGLMQHMHTELNTNGALPSQQSALEYFSADIAASELPEIELSKQIIRGERAIESVYAHGLDMFKPQGQITEADLTKQEIHIGEARVTGKIDLIDTAHGIIRDYKTGKPSLAWPKPNGKSYETLKLHRYRQQLLFYKLMTAESGLWPEADLRMAHLVFLESADHDSVQTLSFEYEPEELDRLKRLIQAVWNKIINLELPDTDTYEQDITGIRQFEEDLLNGN
jgi:DNA helicase-2/ATP-dependent DNA helicase PcrA